MRKLRLFHSVLFLLLFLLFSNVFAFADIDEKHSSTVKGKVLVKYKDTDTSEKGLFRFSSKTFSTTEIIEVNDSSIDSVIKNLESNPNIEYAEPIFIRHALNTKKTVVQSVYAPNDTYIDNQWALSAIEIQDAWKEVPFLDRKSVTIAIIDTGVDLNHPDLASSIVPGYDFVDNDTVPQDEHGHGTHVAGIAAAIADNGQGIAGVAGGVCIMPLRVLDSNGSGTSDDIAEALRYAADNGADIINLSLGGMRYDDLDGDGEFDDDTFSQFEYDAITYALDKGVIIIAAAGNESNHHIENEKGNLDNNFFDRYRYDEAVGYPAAYNGVIGVGACDYYSDTGFIIADFSNIGAEVDIVAPGVDIFSTYKSNSYDYMSGTSQATPFVSGLAALIKAKNKNLSSEAITNIIYDSAVDLGDTMWDEYFGYGLINAKLAFNTPRINTVLDETDSEDVPSTVSLTFSAIDLDQNVCTSVYEDIYLNVYKYDKGSFSPLSSPNQAVIDIENGRGSIELILPDAGRYRVYADDNSPENKYIQSNIVEFVHKPQSPVSNLIAGTYTSSIAPTLNSDTLDAEIYYTLDGTNPTTASTKYTESISISQSATLKAIAYKNEVLSNISTYTYTINISTPQTPSTGGAPSLNTTPAVNNTPEKITIDQSLLTSTKNTKANEVVINTTTNTTGGFEAAINTSLLNDATKQNKAITIVSDNIAITITPGSIDTASANTIELKSAATEQKKATNQVSKLYTFELLAADKKISKFNKPIKITLSYDPANISDKRKLGVYYLNEIKNTWEYCGGVAKEGAKIQFDAKHFSKYAVLEYKGSFSDITNHWAKDAIELMAAKHVVGGIENQFNPSAKVTRAEFAKMIDAALNLDEKAPDNTYYDIDTNMWYADSVLRCTKAGIITGSGDGSFRPNDEITREQMAKMLMIAYEYKSKNKLSDIRLTQEVKFNDEGLVSNWARSYVRLVEAMKFMNGAPGGLFNPKNNTTKAEATITIMRLMENLELM